MNSAKTAWSKGFKPKQSSRFSQQESTENGLSSPSPMRKSYAAASAVTLPQKNPSMKNNQRLSSMLGRPTSNTRYNKSHERNNRRIRQRSAFGNVDRVERERERQIRKEKYSKIEKRRYSVEELLKVRSTQQLVCVPISNSEEFEGLQLVEAVIPILEEEFNVKQHTTEWYENLKKERAEKAKRYSERDKHRKTSIDKSPSAWRSPAWVEETPAIAPDTLDLEKISKMTAKLTTQSTEINTPFELADMAAKSKQFEQENRTRSTPENLTMPSFFQNNGEEANVSDVLNTPLEDCTRPPEEEVVHSNEKITFESIKTREEEKISLEQEAWKRENARIEYLRHQESLRLKKQRAYEEMMMQRQQQARERERIRIMHLQRQQVAYLPSEWFYRDPQGKIQGPYNSQTMRSWLERKFFKDDLPIAENSPRNRFLPIRQVFPDPRTAFLDIYRGHDYMPPQPYPMQNYFSQSAFEEEPQRMSDYDIKKLQSQEQILHPERDTSQSNPRLQTVVENGLNDFLDLGSEIRQNPTEEEEHIRNVLDLKSEEQNNAFPNTKSQPEKQSSSLAEKPSAPTPSKLKAKPKSRKAQKNIKQNTLPVKLEGLSDNLKKMLGVTKNKSYDSSMKDKPLNNPWKKQEKAQPSSISLRQIQEEEQQKLKQDIINGNYQPNQSKVWANLVANTKPTQSSKSLANAVLRNGLGDKQNNQERKKFLSWYRNACGMHQVGFDERFFDIGVSLATPAELRTLFKNHFGKSQKASKFATEFLNMKEKFSF